MKALRNAVRLTGNLGRAFFCSKLYGNVHFIRTIGVSKKLGHLNFEHRVKKETKTNSERNAQKVLKPLILSEFIAVLRRFLYAIRIHHMFWVCLSISNIHFLERSFYSNEIEWKIFGLETTFQSKNVGFNTLTYIHTKHKIHFSPVKRPTI